MVGRGASWKVFSPMRPLANLSSMYEFMPSMIETTAIRKVTPIRTPIIEKAVFSFCVRIVWAASRTASRITISGRRLSVHLVAGDLAVADDDGPLRMLRHVRFVRHDHDGLALFVEPLEHPEDLLGGGAVQVARGFVRQ